MNSSGMSKPSRLALLISLIIVNARSSGAESSGAESSGEYLQKVMIELQELNVPSSAARHDRLSMNLNYQHADDYQDVQGQDNTYRKLSNVHQLSHQDVPQKPIVSLPVKHTDTAQSTSNNIAQYYAIRDPAVIDYPKVKQQQQQQAEPLAFTRAELAALYKKALERGSTINLASLTQALNTAGGGNAAQQVSSHLRLPLKYPMYNYYFFPLKSFASELQQDHLQSAAIAPMYAATEGMESTQKQLMNPLFVAIGTFISMALLFMMGVLFLPKLPHFELFNARVADDDFLRLTTFVTNAIDGRNVLENFHRS